MRQPHPDENEKLPFRKQGAPLKKGGRSFNYQSQGLSHRF
jgi:hypothetical protein